ncbi:mobilization protein (plasmid) [Candidatus Williamhamiltonella defendens]|uniref:Mobilization protein n=2 Tax=Candidatus Williamhamiltonella defendens TaxID=138072 RepID=A0AAC9VKF1_9ENTR|nr:plasmid mobilization protein MobA [Candidatus Hamiltonella defensa]ASV34518.1 mobilization protein [Candidatus Hamiltonella defensa]AWK17476.1 mobilization protein [Candidatus Hamiltonella defensa]
MSQSEKRKRTALIPSIRCFPEEKEQLKEKAQSAGLNLSTYLIRCGLNRKIKTHFDPELVMELSRLGSLQKRLFNEGKGVLSEEYAQVFVAIQEAILTLGRAE